MTTTEFKKEIYSRIESTMNDEVLSVVYDILQNGLPISEDILNNDSLQKSIDRGLEDKKYGRIINNEDANKEINEWLNK